ncbi:MAG: 30S ribosomal protein S11 [Chlamydiae bacterium]|nr:30S ribosomal protein S11 [Chlamydiota bacterium]MBI3276998.1 30S ribosomal protein S11 [Chlamydiota bacterium]
MEKEVEKKIEKKAVVKKKKVTRSIPVGRVHVKSTFNNTFVSISDLQGNVVSWSSAGVLGFKGAKKSTAYAAQVVAQDCAKKASSYGIREVEVYIKGPGAGRESAVRALQASGLVITMIRDMTPVPHNGCRPPKRRRV